MPPARRFKATYAVTLHNEQLQTSFRVQNLDDKPFDFTAALHTYIEVSGRGGQAGGRAGRLCSWLYRRRLPSCCGGLRPAGRRCSSGASQQHHSCITALKLALKPTSRHTVGTTLQQQKKKKKQLLHASVAQSHMLQEPPSYCSNRPSNAT